jgi:Kef-type K+ transport system membrane component KefB/nucleotide-binding universal stress UspA family protein
MEQVAHMDQPFTAAPHHDVLVFLVQIAILLFTARVFGEIAQRLGQSAVVGEILAGVILGPSLISSLFPALGEWIVPHNAIQGYLLETISMLGVMFLLLITGLETDLALIRHHARTAVGVSLGGILTMFTAGFIIGSLLPDEFLANPDQRLVFALFLAIALSIAAIPVIAKVLLDLKLMRRDVGQTIIAAAMMDDSIGWILLSVVIGLASGAAVTFGTVARSILEVLGLVIFSLTVGVWFARRVTLWTFNHIQSRDKVLSLVVILMFVGGAVTQALGLEALLGAFLVGIIFGQVSSLSRDVVHKLESITFGIFSPIFFAVAGLKINVATLLEPRLILLTLLIIGAATLFKVTGVYIGSRVIGKRDHWSALFFGFGLNTRGSMGVIIANIGLSLGILTQEVFSALVVMAVFTSLLAPTVLRTIIQRVKVTEQEQQRLQREALAEDNIITNVHRVLLPVRVRSDASPIHLAESRILEKIGVGSELAVTLFNVSKKGEEAGTSEYLNRIATIFARHSVTKKVVIGENPADLILDEANRGYDLLVLGAPQKAQDTKVLFNPLTDYLARLSPCPSLIVHAPQIDEDWQPRRILVPTNGSTAAKRAAEVGFALAGADEDTQVSILKVVGAEEGTLAITGSKIVERQLDISHQIVGELQTIGNSFGVATTALVEVASNPAEMILQVARMEMYDLIILGVSVRAGSDRLYMGPLVEQILDNAPCPVLVVNAG